MADLKLHIKKLNCYIQDEGDGDEIFIKYKKERIWPLNTMYQKVNEGEYDLSVEISALDRNSHVKLELWDYDLLSPNDKLGTFNMLVNERGGPFVTDMKGSKSSGSKYSIEWEVY